MKKIKQSVFATAAILVASSASAEMVDGDSPSLMEAFASGMPVYEGPDERFAITPSVGTLGAGLEASYWVTEKVNVRGGFHQFDYDTDFDIEGEDFDAELALESFGMMVDYHPWGGAFRISGGILKNNTSASLNGSYNGSFNFNGQSFSAATPTVVEGKVDFGSVAPVVSVGWNKKVTKNFSLMAELGAMYTGAGDLSISSTGGVSSDPTFQAELEAERAEIQDDLDSFKVYPVIQFGASLRF